jgi:hypothetical protein
MGASGKEDHFQGLEVASGQGLQVVLDTPPLQTVQHVEDSEKFMISTKIPPGAPQQYSPWLDSSGQWQYPQAPNFPPPKEVKRRAWFMAIAVGVISSVITGSIVGGAVGGSLSDKLTQCRSVLTNMR